MKKLTHYFAPILTLCALLCLSGCGQKGTGPDASKKQDDTTIATQNTEVYTETQESGETIQAATNQETDATNMNAVDETVPEEPVEEPPKYVLDRSDIPEEANTPVLNLKTDAELTYDEVLDDVEQQANDSQISNGQAGDGQVSDGRTDDSRVDVTNYQLSIPQIKDLTKRYTDGELFWKLDVDGVEVTPDAKELDISGHDLAALNFDTYGMFELLPNLKRIDMCGCGYSNEEMATLQDTFPDIRIIWEIQMSHWKVRTDVVAFSSMKTCSQGFFMENDEAKYFKYCTDLVALDIGHNHVWDVSFLEYLPNLKILILVDNVKGWDEDGRIHRLDDVSVLKNLTKLEYLEFFCNSVSDISFLEYTPNIVDLNISYNRVSDASYLFELPHLERLFLEHTRIPYSEFEKLKETYPNAQIEYYGEGSIDHNWRKHERYFAMRDMFKNNYIHPLFADKPEVKEAETQQETDTKEDMAEPQATEDGESESTTGD